MTAERNAGFTNRPRWTQDERVILQRIRAGWLPHRIDDRWCWGRLRYGVGFFTWVDGHVPVMSVVEPMTDDEVTAWLDAVGERRTP